MAQKIFDIYAAVEKEKGMSGKMRLAIITGIPSAKASETPDTPDLMAKFAVAFKEITGTDCPIS